MEFGKPRSPKFARRTTLVLGNAGALLAGKVLGMVGSALLVRAIIDVGGASFYGMWAVCGHLLAYSSVLDLGLGLGLQNAVSHANGTKDYPELSGSAHKATLTLGGIGAFTFGLFLLGTILFPRNLSRVFGPTVAQADRGLGLSLLVLAVLAIAMQVVLQIPVRMAAGLQRIKAPTIAQGLSSIIGVFVFYLLSRLGLSPIVGLAIAALLPIFSGAVVGTVELRLAGLDWLHRRGHANDNTYQFLVGNSLIMFGSQVASLVIFQTDVIIVSIVSGSIEAAKYELCARLLLIPSMIQGVLLGALWPAVGQAWSERDLPWIRRTYWKMLIFTLVVMIPGLLIASLTSSPLIRFWTGQVTLIPDQRLVWSYCLLAASSMWAGLHATSLNAIGSIRFPASIAGLQAALNLVVVLHFAASGGWAVALSSACVSLTVNALPLFLRWHTELGSGD